MALFTLHYIKERRRKEDIKWVSNKWTLVKLSIIFPLTLLGLLFGVLWRVLLSSVTVKREGEGKTSLAGRFMRQQVSYPLRHLVVTLKRKRNERTVTGRLT